MTNREWTKSAAIGWKGNGKIPSRYSQHVLEGGLAEAVADGVVLRSGGADDAAQERREGREWEAVGEARDLDVLNVARTFAMWVRAFEERGLMSSARPSRVTTTASWLRGFWSKNSSMKGGKINLQNRERKKRRE